MTSQISNWYSRWLSQANLRRLQRLVEQVEALDFTEADLPSVMASARDLPPPAALVHVFAAAREAIRRETGLRLHKVQVLGGLVLTERRVAEMKTGEGKTLTLVAPVAWHALKGGGVHVVTANPYLAERDSAALRPVYAALGLTTGCVSPSTTQDDRRAAYGCSITYGVNHEFGFDYLRDLRAKSPAERVQRGLASAFVDELDAILIDDARTPLVLSGEGDDRSHEYRTVYAAARQLLPGEDYVVDERERSAAVTDRGYAKAETFLVEEGLLGSASELYAPANTYLAAALAKAVQARSLFLHGRDYLVEAGEVVLVDSSTGRALPGRRLEEGLHEMLEAKEGVAIRRSSRTLGSVTYQNFFSLYGHLCGLTGTAFTEAEELLEVYGLQTVVVPTHRPVRRDERPDMLVSSRAAKLDRVVDIALECSSTGQPLLVGTGSVRDAHAVAQALRAAGLLPEVLTAEHVQQEAAIVARAGRRGALTVATSVAGRGTDIALGGAEASSAEAQAVSELGGLFVLGFGRNPLRRVDLQLQGRSARQGDRGTSQFVLSLEDDLLRAFAQNSALRRAAEALSSGQGLAGSVITRLVSAAQKAAERRGFEARQALQKFDLVVAEQRQAFFSWRTSLLEPGKALEYLVEQASNLANSLVLGALDEQIDPAQWPLLQVKAQLRELGVANAPVMRWAKEDMDVAVIASQAGALAAQGMAAVDPLRAKEVLLIAADRAWSAHLAHLDELMFAVNLASKIGKNPSFEFSRRAFDAFAGLMQSISSDACAELTGARSAAEFVPPPRSSARALVEAALDARWVTRNEACPCGSGKRYKHCHGRSV